MTKKKRRWLRFLHFSKNFCKSFGVFALRTFLLFSMLTVLAAVTGWILFLRTFNPQHISEMLTQELQTRLGRPVIISSLDLAFVNTLELKGFSVLDTEGEPGHALVSAESVMLTFSLPALLEKKLIIENVTLVAPRFNIIRRENGLHNIPQIQTPQRESVYTSKSGERFVVHVNNWTVKDAVLSYKDLKTSVTHALYGLNLYFEKLRFDELSRFTLNMVLRSEWGDNISDTEIEGTGHVNLADFHWDQFALRSFRAQAYLFRKPVEITLDVDNLRQPYFNLQAAIPAFTNKDLSLFHLENKDFSFPKSTLTAKGVWQNDYQQIKLEQATLAAADIKATGSGLITFAQPSYVADFNVATNTFSLAGKEKYWPLLAKYKMQGNGTLSAQIKRQGGKFSVPLFRADVKNAQGELYTFPLEDVTGEIQIKDHFTDWYVRTKTGKVQVDRSIFEKLQLSTTWRKGNLYAHIADSDLNGIPFRMNVTVNNLKNKNRKIRTNLYLRQLDPMAFIGTVQDFVTVISPLVGAGPAKPEVTGELAWLRNFRDRLPNFMPNLTGTFAADTFASQILSGSNFDAEFDFTGLEGGAARLNGTLNARLEGGVIHQMEKLAEEQQALNVTFQPFIIMNRMEKAGSFKVGKVLKDVVFSDMAVAAEFENGKMNIKNAYTVGPTISANVSGWTDWVKETFDLTIWTMFHNTSRGSALAENLTDESGNPALAFRVSAAMNKPKLEMKSAKKAGQTIQAAQEQGLPTDFHTAEEFLKGEFHAKK